MELEFNLVQAMRKIEIIEQEKFRLLAIIEDLRHEKGLPILLSKIEECDNLKYEIRRLKCDTRPFHQLQNAVESEELEMYRKLLKCNSCHLNDKSTVLLKCMHVFCRPCIDTRLETRQRKCPNCGESFGVADVKAIYL